LTNMEDLMRIVSAPYVREVPAFKPGDTIRVWYKVREGDNERLQAFEGIVISIRGEGVSKMFTVRKFSYGVYVERIYPLYSPMIHKIEIISRGRPRRAKLYYLRKMVGKTMVVEKASPEENVANSDRKSANESL
jgi:large subunit ribosomal protein L19